MSKYSDFMAWRVSFESKANSERDAIVSSTFPLEVSQEIQADADAGIIDQDTGAEAVAAILYADHVTAELQAENAALRAKVAELEKHLDSLSNSYATCGNPDCTPTQVCELFFDGCRS